MNTYLVAYDLLKPETGSNYVALISYMKSAFNYWAKPQQSLWLVKTAMPIDQVRTNIRQKIDSNDRLMVIDITGDNWATYNQSATIAQWMQNNI